MLLKDLEARKFLYWFMSSKYYLHFSRIFLSKASNAYNRRAPFCVRWVALPGFPGIIEKCCRQKASDNAHPCPRLFVGDIIEI